MTLTEPDFDYVAGLVREHAAIVLHPGKQYLVESRLAPLAHQRGLPDVSSLIRALRQQPSGALHASVVDAMTTNETTFFRDHHPWEALREEILPELIAARAADRRLTFWCAAASSGQEPYSIAMLLQEHFPQLASWNVRIVASDLSAVMLGRAAAGRYTKMEVGRGLPPTLLSRYFVPVGHWWQVREEIRQMVEFRSVNLVKPWPVLPKVDVLLLRNVLIYFDLPSKRDVLARVREVLRDDGYLFLGTSESTMKVDDAFVRVQRGNTTCYRIAPRG